MCVCVCERERERERELERERERERVMQKTGRTGSLLCDLECPFHAFEVAV